MSEIERENARLREHMTEAWKLVNAMAGQEYWQRAEDWLAENIEYAPREIISANVTHHPRQPEASVENTQNLWNQKLTQLKSGLALRWMRLFGCL